MPLILILITNKNRIGNRFDLQYDLQYDPQFDPQFDPQSEVCTTKSTKTKAIPEY